MLLKDIPTSYSRRFLTIQQSFLSVEKVSLRNVPRVIIFPFSVAEVHDMGWKMLRRLYQQAVLIAKTITMKDKEDEAVTEFTKYLNSSELYFNEHPFPENESNEEAHLKCKSVQGKIFIEINLFNRVPRAFPL